MIFFLGCEINYILITNQRYSRKIKLNFANIKIFCMYFEMFKVGLI